MAVESFANTASTTLSAAMTDTTGTSMSVTSATGFPPSGQYRIKIDSELFIVTGGQGTTTWTVTRGAESSTAATHSNGAAVTHVLTSASLARVVEGRAVVASADASYDFSAATGLWLPQSAGASPANTGQIAHDTTRRMLKTRDAVFGNSILPETLSSAASTADTLSAATITTTETNFSQQVSLPANYFIAGKTIIVFLPFQFTATAVPTTILRYKTSTSVAGAGNTLFSTQGNTLPSATNQGGGIMLVIAGTGAPGASVNVITGFMGQYVGTSPLSTNRTAQPVAIATNAGITLCLSAQYSAGTAANSITLLGHHIIEIN